MADDGRGPISHSQHSPAKNKNRSQEASSFHHSRLRGEEERRRPAESQRRLLAEENFHTDRGPRSIIIKRSDHGFGFTLRHFIVYPPESYTIFGGGGGGGDGRMDTIFVKSVVAGSRAEQAGLCTGDRVIGVNGEATTGRPYAHVVRLIQHSPSFLHLLVVPWEEDLLQLYFGDTAHYPETNARPGRSRVTTDMVVGAGRQGLSPQHRSLPASSPPRRSSEGNNSGGAGVSLPPESCDYGSSESVPGGYSLSAGAPGCRLSLDAGVVTRRDSQDTSSLHSSDDSIIMSRIKKSCEQKEEFLRRGLGPPPQGGMWPGSGSPPPLKEFYSRPQKLQAPVWPPAIPASSVSPIRLPPDPPKDPPHHHSGHRGFLYGGPVTNAPPVLQEGRFTARLGRIQECSGGGVRTTSPSPPPSLKIVSERARQFESGKCLSDRTDLYRSELARLATKRNVPNVAVRRREFENRAADWRAQRESRSLDSTTTGSVSPSPGSNRTIPVGNPKLHCDPPPSSDYQQSSGFDKKEPPRPRSNSLEGTWAEKRPLQRHKAVRQDSYLAAVKKPVAQVPESPAGTPERDGGTPDSSPGFDGAVTRRAKSTIEDPCVDDERATRRVSYLKATWGDRMYTDSDFESSDTEPFPTTIRSVVSVPPCDKEVILEGNLTCKLIQVEGKKAHDRSWKQAWAVLRGSDLFLFKDKKDATSETPVDHERIDLRTSVVTTADDYTKRRHVLRLSTPSASEILLQTESPPDMAKWLQALSQQDNNNTQTTQGETLTVSPVAAHKGIMKLTSFRNRSPTGQSPVNKTRKPSQTDVPVGSPKSKTWKGRVAKQFRKMQTGAGSPVSPTAPSLVSYPEGATIGIPLELCPQSKKNDRVPLLVELCTDIVEERGLEIIGIYRVPGNTAAVSSLTEAVNKDIDSAIMDQDQRWNDVNVISSLLKSFFRRLPDCLLTTELYSSFIQADKIEDPKRRILSIRKLVHELPEHHFETLKHLIKHLKQIVLHSNVNKMEAKNLAIVFGPTLVRNADDNMVTMVTDMSHQCRIVETLIQYCDWCFSDESLESLCLKDAPDTSSHIDPESAVPNQSLLLDNVHKIEGMKESSCRTDVNKRDLMSSVITAATRKMHKSKTRKAVTSSLFPGEVADDKRGEKGKSGSKGGVSRDQVDRGHQRAGSVGTIASSVRESVLFSETIANKLASSPTNSLPPVSSESEKSVDKSETRVDSSRPPVNDGTILTYTGLSQTTQERIRRFELETKAMLQRDSWRGRDSDLEVSSSRASSEISCSSNASPIAITEKIALEGNASGLKKEFSPLDRWRQITNPSSVSDNQEKRTKHQLKTTIEVSSSSSNMVRRGSLDSLKDAVILNSDRINNSLPDECGDLVMSLTSTFDAKMRSLSLPKDERWEEEALGPPPPSATTPFQDPSLHKNCTSPLSEMKVLEREVKEKEDVEKDDEKENCGGKLKRSESLNRREEKKEPNKLRRTESLNKKEGKGGGGGGEKGLKRSDSLTKTEKTESNLNKRRQALEVTTATTNSGGGKTAYKMKRKTGLQSERSIKRRHTVGGTKDFDKAAWLDNRQREEELLCPKERRTSSPDLSSCRQHNNGGVLMEVVFRPHSLLLVDTQPLESHI